MQQFEDRLRDLNECMIISEICVVMLRNYDYLEIAVSIIFLEMGGERRMLITIVVYNGEDIILMN